ncbi:MAG: hypothetical protein ACI8RZ_007294 [Myxococcota bacterium]|jgi:hypothetical protein
MSYRSIVEITERLHGILSEPLSPEEAFDEMYGPLQDLVALTREATLHQSRDAGVQARFARLHGQLSAIGDNLSEGEYHEQIWLTLQEALSVSERIAAVRPMSDATLEGSVLLDPSKAMDLLKSDPEALLQQADAECRADPGSIVGAYLTAASQLCLGRLADALATADALVLHYPARHVVTLSAIAAMLQGRQEDALARAQDGLYLRLEARRPEPWFRIPGLRTLSREKAEAIRQVNITIVQMALEWLDDVGLDEGHRMLFIGLLAPSLSQSRLLLDEHRGVATTPLWSDAIRLGLARCARWRCDFMEAGRILEGMTGHRPRRERSLLSRDRRLLEAGEIELSGFGITLSIYRTATGTGFSWEEETAQLTDHEDRSQEQIADLLKDLASSWIGTGFSHRIIQVGALPEDGEEEDDVELPDIEPLVDIDRFFALYDAEKLDDVLVFASEVLNEKPHAVTAWGMRILVYLIRGQWAEAAYASERAVALSGCRALGAARVLRPASEGSLGEALNIGMKNLTLRLRSATPELPIELPGFPAILEQEGDLLDQIELNTWRMLDGMLSAEDDDIPEQTSLQIELLSALMAPNPANTIQQLEAMMPRLETHLALKSAAATALCRWRRYEGNFDAAQERLSEARRAMPGLSFIEAERLRLERDLRLCEQEELTIRGFSITLEVSRTDRLLQRSFTPDSGSNHQTLTSWVEDPRPQAPALVMRDMVVSWLESGFSLLGEGPGD